MEIKTLRQELKKDGLNMLYWEKIYESKEFNPKGYAVIVCDMWDRHWSKNATFRVGKLAPELNKHLCFLREQGAVIIHCPSETLHFYKSNPARLKAASYPDTLSNRQRLEIRWAKKHLKFPKHPIETRGGGCDSGERSPIDYLKWKRQIESIYIDEEKDYISESFEKIFNILKHHGIEDIIYTGVHTNMCILNRGFGMKNMKAIGFNVMIARDATDAMCSPHQAPYLNHADGVKLCVEYIEKFVGKSVSLEDLTGVKAEYNIVQW